MNIPWEDVQLFLAIAETGSVSSASKRLAVRQPTVSRRLADLEYRLGYKLFRRTVTGARLTTAGERLVIPAKRMAEWAGEVGRVARSSDNDPFGVVRVTAAPGVAFEVLTPFAAWLRTKHPQLRIELLTSIEYLDLGRGEADLALRTKPAPEGGDLTTVASIRFKNGAFVSREYQKRLPKKYSLADIDWIAWAPPYEMVPPNPQLQAMIPHFTPVFTSDNFLIQQRAARAGIGAVVGAHVTHRFEEKGGLVPLDLDFGPHAMGEIHLVCAKSALDIARVRVVAELLRDELLAAAKSGAE